MTPYLLCLFLSLLVISCAETGTQSRCGREQTSNIFLDLAIEFIEKAKLNFPTCPKLENVSCSNQKPVDCEELLRCGHNESRVYKVWPRNKIINEQSIDVFCDMDTDEGGWTVIQRRGNFRQPEDYFYQDWASYKNGFGNIDEDFWLGNDNIFALTNQRLYSARFDLTDVDEEHRYALYETFWIDSEKENYKLTITDYSGDANDSMTYHNGQSFSTKDVENDNEQTQNCAEVYKGAWWYNSCHESNLNGLYLRGRHETYADGVNWYSWKGYYESLEKTEIKIRPKNFRKNTSQES